MSDPVFVFTADGVTINVYAVEVDGGLQFTIETIQDDPENPVRIDINGFFLDIGGDGGDLTKVEGQNANNMKGGNNDGYDHAVGLGTVGGNDEDYTGGTFFIEGLTLANLEGSDAGLRATSYGEDGEGSLKLVADYEPPAPPPPPEDDFFPDFKEEYDHDISNVVFYFDDGEGGIYTVKIDGWDEVDWSNDLDDTIDEILAYLIECDDNITEDSVLLGVAIKGGQEEKFFAYGEFDENGTEPDDLPGGLEDFITDSSLDNEFDAVDVMSGDCVV